MTWLKNGLLKPPARREFLFSTVTLTKIHKPVPVGRPIISGCDGPTEKISSFVDTLLQPIAQKQQSYIKDTTDFISFIENTKIGQDTILVAMDVCSLYTNLPQEEGIKMVKNSMQGIWDVPQQWSSDPYTLSKGNACLVWSLQTTHLSSIKKIISKHMVSQWAQKQQCLLLIYSWRR